MIYASNVDQVAKDLEAFLLAAERKATLKLKVIGGHALRWLATNSPQYSGDFAANWKVAINGIDLTFNDHAVSAAGTAKARSVGQIVEGHDAAMFQQGSAPAVSFSFSHGGPVINRARVGDTITISNSAVHDEPYAWKIEKNQIKFRDENPDGGRVIERFITSFRNLPT
ncbi:hypothetical protein [Ferribacterium limneticum]|uniref:hypothetical protein n=1 Tax=Ferribacterium limneticum TaxID=76259 RepID=UPI001CF8A8CA|nr:hypothetical protein [Ferribacterium limneticum]UCV26798.1 hypothetical protein KI617_10795 [Ferribacterium limneticum]UCV30715.1 hypothetical protein KI608_10795 [Ferribacterium limneticum]